MDALLRNCPDAPANSASERAGYRARTRASAAVSEFAAWAPIRSPPSGKSSMSRNAKRLMSTKCVGRSISSFMRSSRLVPPLMNLAPGLAAAVTAARASVARS